MWESAEWPCSSKGLVMMSPDRDADPGRWGRWSNFSTFRASYIGKSPTCRGGAVIVQPRELIVIGTIDCQTGVLDYRRI